MGATVAQLVSALYNLPLPNKQSQENKLVDTVNINTRWLDNWENTPVNENEKLMLTTIVGQPKSIISVCWNGPRQTTYPLKKKKKTDSHHYWPHYEQILMDIRRDNHGSSTLVVTLTHLACQKWLETPRLSQYEYF